MIDWSFYEHPLPVRTLIVVIWYKSRRSQGAVLIDYISMWGRMLFIAKPDPITALMRKLARGHTDLTGYEGF